MLASGGVFSTVRNGPHHGTAEARTRQIVTGSASRAVSEQMRAALESATSPFLCALSTRAAVESVAYEVQALFDFTLPSCRAMGFEHSISCCGKRVARGGPVSRRRIFLPVHQAIPLSDSDTELIDVPRKGERGGRFVWGHNCELG